MLQQMIEYLIQNPDVIEKVKSGTASFIGLSEMEQKAVLDVFGNTLSMASASVMEYWQ